MRRRSPWCSGFAALILLAGCAGRDFTRPAPESLVLGKTTYAEINGRFGSPYRESTVIKNEKTIRMASYAYAASAGEPLVGGVTPARGIDFGFVDQVPSIKKGVTTRDEVIALLGPPTGVQTYPMIAGKEDTGLGWMYTQVKGGFGIKIHQKTVVISVNPAGVVTDVQLTVSGER